MAQPYVYRQVQFGPGYITPVVRNLIIANVAVFLVQSILSLTSFRGFLELHGGMTPSLFIKGFHLWQPVTYMFLHGGVMHLIFNMFFLWMFGTEVEQRIGSRMFSVYYFFCGIGAGLLTCLFWQNWDVPTIGASGAIFGVLLAFGLLFPDRMVLLFFVIPVRAFYFAIGIGVIELYYLIFMPKGSVSYIAHVGGMLFGYIYLRFNREITIGLGKVRIKKPGGAQSEKRSFEEDQRRVDEILDKINREGIHRLTRAERNFLREHAHRNKS